LNNAGLDQPKTIFLSLSTICDGIAQLIYDAWTNTSSLYELQSGKLLGLTTDGTTTMVGVYIGFTTKIKRDILRLLSTHCIAH
jgi:hypothetical protein